MSSHYYFTSESVSEGHPDKVADQISDAVLDAIFAQDPHAKVACETFVTTDLAVVGGEFKTTAKVDIEAIARQTISEIGYTHEDIGFDATTCTVRDVTHTQSPDINQGVEREDGEIGAGDQGLMFGYATDETPEFMPLAIALSHRLVERQAELRKSGKLSWLRPDAKSQITLLYENDRPVHVEKVVLSTQHSPEVSNEELREAVTKEIIYAVIPESLRSPSMELYVNPTGRFVVGGPHGDTGLTGRKIIVDTYGGSCPHGGGAFSGKDPTKVDRSAAYAARYIAKNIVAAGLAKRCTVQLAYAIGVPEPLSVMINCHGTSTVDEQKLEAAVRAVFQLTPKGIIEMLDLRRPMYRKTAAYGHFGRELPEFTWEKTDRVDALKDFISQASNVKPLKVKKSQSATVEAK